MSPGEFLDALKQFANGASVEMVSLRDGLFELKLLGQELPRRIFLEFKLSPDGAWVTEVHYSSFAGAIEDPSAFPTILKKNYRGVMGGKFYFSGVEMEGHYFLMLETRQLLHPSTTTNEAVGLLMSFWTDEIFLFQWEGFPSGVQNFLC